MAQRRTIEHLAPWLGMVGAAMGWILAHQLGSNTVFDDCRVGDGGFVLMTGLLGLSFVIGGGYFSWDVWRRAEETEGRRFIGLLGFLLALLTGFAIILQTASGLKLPACAA